jgi:hypothetical protein
MNVANEDEPYMIRKTATMRSAKELALPSANDG